MKKEMVGKTHSPKVVKRRGRPELPEEKRKKSRRITVSDDAWSKLDERLSNLNVKTVSELVEKVGQGDLSVIAYDPDPILNIPIYRRLQSLMDEPVAVFWSLLGFTRRMMQQLGFPEYMLAEEQDLSSNIQESVVLRASTIIFFVGYTHGDILINNPSSLMRWLIFRILKADPRRTNETNAINKTLLISNNEKVTQELICKIANAMASLEASPRALNYQALKAKTIDGLTVKQISRIFMIQGENKDKTEIAGMIKEGLSLFREKFYQDSSNFKKDENSIDQIDWKNHVDQYVKDYCRLALFNNVLTKKDQDRLEEIVLQTSKNANLDFWLNEIDYQIALQNDLLNRSLREKISSSLKTLLTNKKDDIDRGLIGCTSAYRVREVLEVYANREVGVDQCLESELSFLSAEQLLG